MVLKLYRGETCLRTIYNVVKISSEEYGALIVKQNTMRCFSQIVISSTRTTTGLLFRWIKC